MKVYEKLNEPGALAAMYGGQVLELNDEAPEQAQLVPLTLQDEEGRRIYERSLRFVLLLAARRLWPGQKLRIQFSVGRGVLFHLTGRSMTADMLNDLRSEMEAITAAAIPFERTRWTKDKAIAWFEAQGQADQTALLRRRKQNSITMYGCGGFWEYFYGAMAQTTADVRIFRLQLWEGGAILFMPEPEEPPRVAPYVPQRKHLQIFTESERWCDILGVRNLTDLAEMMERGHLRQFIRVNEALHEQALSDMARRIVGAGKRIILVAGPSSSGKTTFAGRLGVHMQVEGCLATRISLDDYYLDRESIPPEPDGSLDLEHIQTLDIPLLKQHLGDILDGREVLLPRFDFKSGQRAPEGVPFRLGPGEALIIEGIHALNPILTEGLSTDRVHKVFVSALSCINLDDHNRIRTTDVRLMRRMVRDMLFRGTRPEATLAMWDSVRRGEDRWVFPWQEQADDMFNTTLHYELLFLRRACYRLLLAVPADDPNAVLAGRLRKLLNYVPDVDEALLSEIPPLSLLREFIGGCTMEEPG